MLRLLIGTGLVLMSVGFGAAGWQYWQSLPKPAPTADADPVAAASAAPAPSRQSWLISPTGGLVLRQDAEAYLAQERLVPARTVQLRLQADLVDLLADGEKLPEPAFLEVLSDIRAPKVAEGFCPVLRETLAQDCAVQSARVVKGSVDQVLGTALFQIELVYRLKDASTELPDLAAHVLRLDTVPLDLASDAAAAAGPEDALRAAIRAATEACASDAAGDVCRPMRLALTWLPGQTISARAEIASLDPLPKGMFMAPPLVTASGD